MAQPYVGEIRMFAGNFAPAGWMFCEGQILQISENDTLFQLIGTTYGAGDGSTTFNLPDLRGEFIRGWDNGRGADPGRVFGSWQGAETRSHQHGTPYAHGVVSNNSSGAVMMVGTGSMAWTSSSGGNETRPRNVAMLACIKY